MFRSKLWNHAGIYMPIMDIAPKPAAKIKIGNLKFDSEIDLLVRGPNDIRLI
jgi:hypothetical protein